MTRDETRIEETSDDRIEIRSGGGCLSLFGLPFLAAGIFLSLIALGVVHLENADDVPTWGWPLLFGMGMIFATVGGQLAFGRNWVIIDRRQGALIKQWGLLRPMKQDEHSLRGYCAVVLRHTTGGSESGDGFPVLLQAGAGGQDVTLASLVNYAAAHEQATAIARFLRLPLNDATTGHDVLTQADELDEPLRD